MCGVLSLMSRQTQKIHMKKYIKQEVRAACEQQDLQWGKLTRRLGTLWCHTALQSLKLLQAERGRQKRKASLFLAAPAADASGSWLPRGCRCLIGAVLVA